MNKLFELLNKGDFADADYLIKSEDINLDSFEDYEWMDTDYCGGGHDKLTIVSYLASALENYRLDIAEYLLSRGANLSKFADQILKTLAKCDKDYSFEALQLLIKHKGEYLLHHYKSYNGNNFLHVLSTLKPGAYSSFNTPQFNATTKPNLSYFPFSLEQINILMQIHQPSATIVNQQNSQGETPVYLAIRNNNAGLFQWLLKTNKADLTIKNNNQWSAEALLESASNEIKSIYMSHMKQQAAMMPSQNKAAFFASDGNNASQRGYNTRLSARR